MEKCRWKDTHVSHKDPTVKESNVFLGTLRLSVHHYIGCGDTWFASCHEFFSAYELVGVTSVEDAKIAAAEKLRGILSQCLNRLENISTS